MDDRVKLPEFDTLEHHPAIEELSQFFVTKIGNDDPKFFRLICAYFLCLPASMMHVQVDTKIWGKIPINIYTLALAESGSGKGHSTNLMREFFFQGFRDSFIDNVVPEISEQALWRRASRDAARKGTDEDHEYGELNKTYEYLGAMPFTFDNGSGPAIKQVRQKILMAECGALNLEIDEIGKNIEGSNESLTLFLELFDQGITGSKIKVSGDTHRRVPEIFGKSPANLYMFGEPTSLFDGSTAENAFYKFLSAGYARRCLFAYGRHNPVGVNDDPQVVYDRLMAANQDLTYKHWQSLFTSLADPGFHQWVIQMPEEVGVLALAYKLDCERRSNEMSRYEQLRKAEMRHRYFKMIKLAGGLAFLDQSNTLDEQHLLYSIKLVEESGDAFQSTLKREHPYMKLAQYIADQRGELTEADMKADLPFYNKSAGVRKDLMADAIAWGYKNNIVIKRQFVDGIEFFEGESLAETNLDDMIFSFSEDLAHDYAANEDPVSFDELENLVTAEDMNFCNHLFLDGHRHGDNLIRGFNMLVFDFDSGIPMHVVCDLFEDYRFLAYTTKRHTEEHNRFRLLLPTNYVLKMTREEYKLFMETVTEWMPFPNDNVDEGSWQPEKKWLCNPDAEVYFSEGKQLFDVLPFIPKTSRNQAYNDRRQELRDMDSLERYFAERMVNGSRNNQMIKFALALLDSGMTEIEVEQRVQSFNAQLSDGLSQDEIDKTIMQTVRKRALMG